MIGTTTFRVVCSAVGLCALLGYLNERRFVVELHQQGEVASSALTTANRYMLEHEQILERGNETREKCETTSETTYPPTTIITEPATPATPVSTESTTINPITFNADNPLLVLSLPNNGLELAMPRYFECAGYDTTKVGRHWTGSPQPGVRKPHRWPIGQIMKDNIKKGKPLFHGAKFHVYTDLQFIQAPSYKPKVGMTRPPDCFDPVLFPGALERLYHDFPNATIVNVVGDPVEWSGRISPQFPHFWSDWCNKNHNNTFPTEQEVGHQRPMVGFYMEYQHRLRHFAKAHPSLNYVEINLEDSGEVTATKLEQKLGIQAQCWTQSTQGNIDMVPDPAVPTVIAEQPRPNTVGFPMLVTAMPKAGTSTMHDYFRCGMGDWTSAHQWTHPLAQEPHHGVPVGECMIANTENDRYPFLDGCGHQLVWSDTGVLRQGSKYQKRLCYFPFLHRDGLERFYKSYPYGTILNTVRNYTSWVNSAFRWRNLPDRWVNAQCEGFPKKRGLPHEEWEAWYDGVQETIRQFAREHPTMTYIEVPLSDQTGSMLNDVFHFPEECWGHANVNKKTPEKKPENATSSS